MKCKDCEHTLIKVPIKFKWVHKSSGKKKCIVVWCDCNNAEPKEDEK